MQRTSYRQETHCRRRIRSKERQQHNVSPSWLREIAQGALPRSTRFCRPCISLRGRQPSAKCRPTLRLQRCAARENERGKKEERAPIGIRVFSEEKSLGLGRTGQTERQTDRQRWKRKQVLRRTVVSTWELGVLQI